LIAPINPLLNQNPSNVDSGNNDSNRNIGEDQLYIKRNWSAEEDPALSKRAMKLSFVAIYEKATGNTNTLENFHSSLPAPSKADEDVDQTVATINPAAHVDLAGNKLYSKHLEQKLRQVFAILDDPRKDQRGNSIRTFVEKNVSLADALKKFDEQQSNAVWGFPVGFLGITTKSDRFVRGEHLLKSNLNLNLYLRDVMLEEDNLVFRPFFTNFENQKHNTIECSAVTV